MCPMNHMTHSHHLSVQPCRVNMKTSAAERQRKRRAKLKAEGKYEEYKAKANEYSKTWELKKKST